MEGVKHLKTTFCFSLLTESVINLFKKRLTGNQNDGRAIFI